METVTICEYMIDNDKVVQLTHQAEVRGNKYIFKAGKSKYLKILREDEFGEVISNHVFAMEDDYKKYRNLIIQCLEERVSKEQKKLKRDEEILLKVKCAAVQQDTGFDADVIGCYMTNYKVPNVCPVATGGWCRNYTMCQNLAYRKEGYSG